MKKELREFGYVINSENSNTMTVHWGISYIKMKILKTTNQEKKNDESSKPTEDK